MTKNCIVLTINKKAKRRKFDTFLCKWKEHKSARMRHMTPCHKKKCNGINKSFPTQNKRTKNKIIYKITSEASLRSQQQTRNISNLRELGFG